MQAVPPGQLIALEYALSNLIAGTGAFEAQVARAVGYESQSKFSAEFKKVFGMLPSEFRKLHAGH